MISVIENLIFRSRRLVVALFLLMTVFMVWQASHLKIDAGFAKMLPLKHPYMQTYLEHRDAFGGANRVVIAIKAREGDIFTPEFFEVLAEARLTCDDADQVVAETRLAAEFCRHACKQAQYKLKTPGGDLKEVSTEGRTELRDELRGLIKRFKKLWLIRNRSGGLADSTGRLEKILGAY